MRRESIAITTSAGGAFTGYCIGKGKVQQVRYVPHATAPLDTGADFTITEEDTGLAILTASNVGTSAVSFYPRAATCGITGTAALYASGGEGVFDKIGVYGRIKLVVAQGGNVLQGTLYVWLDK